MSKKPSKKSAGASKKKATKKKAAKKKAAKKGAKRGKRAPPEAPAWGPPIVLGTVGGRVIEIQPPVNQAAVQTLSPDAAVVLVLNARLVELGEQVKGLEAVVSKLRDDLNLSSRLAAIENKLNGPSSD